MRSRAVRTLRTWFAIGLLVLLVACSHPPRKVDCDGRLEPINAVNPRAPASPSVPDREP
jgi:hypothetical protein